MATTLARFTQSACPAPGAVRGKHCTAADAVGAVSTGRRIAPLFLCERLRLGAGWCNAPSPVLRGAGNEPSHGRDIVAPPGNQAATENTNFCLHDGENPAYSPNDLAPLTSRPLPPSPASTSGPATVTSPSRSHAPARVCFPSSGQGASDGRLPSPAWRIARVYRDPIAVWRNEFGSAYQECEECLTKPMPSPGSRVSCV